jgi:hypothetical protein
MRLRLPGQMSAPMTHTALGQGTFSAGAGSSVSAGGPAAFLPGPSGSGPAQLGGISGSNAASNNRRWQMMQPQMSGSMQSSMAGPAGLTQQQQQQQGVQSRSSSAQLSLQGMPMQGSLSSRTATPAGQSVMYAEAMGALSPEASLSQVRLGDSLFPTELLAALRCFLGVRCDVAACVHHVIPLLFVTGVSTGARAVHVQLG